MPCRLSASFRFTKLTTRAMFGSLLLAVFLVSTQDALGRR